MQVEQSHIEEFFRCHSERLTGFCTRILGNREAAEDVVQDVFLEACSKPDLPLTLPWLCTCARNRCIDFHRRRGLWEKLKLRLVPMLAAEGREYNISLEGDAYLVSMQVGSVVVNYQED